MAAAAGGRRKEEEEKKEEGRKAKKRRLMTGVKIMAKSGERGVASSSYYNHRSNKNVMKMEGRGKANNNNT